MGISALLAALLRRQETGEGAWIDIAQYETGLVFLAGALLDYHETGHEATRNANADAGAAPHDAFPCADDAWLALSCWSDAQFAALTRVLCQPELAQDARFVDCAARQRNAAVLYDVIARWTQGQTAPAAASLLQQAGVHAYPVNTVADLMHDPQLVHRHVWRRRRHAVLGDQTYCFPAFELSETPGDITAAGPRLAADNETVFRNFIGLTDEQHAACQRAGAFD
jgi:crotonobetainyl-CoA:carnitine CoA-transferase CaiB-like acyl-CoA transferase